VLVELPGLVVRRLQDGSSTHRRLGRCDQGKVLASDAEKNLPANRVSFENPIASDWNIDKHLDLLFK